MRAGRLLNLLLLLQNNRRVTARELASRLEVSERTIFRDIEALGSAGVPVFAVRGPKGGFQLLDTFEQTVPALPPGLSPARGQLRRVRVRLSPAALYVATLHGKPEGWRRRPSFDPLADRPDWIEGSFRFGSYDEAARDLLAIGPDVEVVLPQAFRQTMAELGRHITLLHES